LLILLLLLSFSLKFTPFLPAYGFGLLLGGEKTRGFVVGDLQKTKENISFLWCPRNGKKIKKNASHNLTFSIF
jgi:hypothetical protein